MKDEGGYDGSNLEVTLIDISLKNNKDEDPIIISYKNDNIEFI